MITFKFRQIKLQRHNQMFCVFLLVFFMGTNLSAQNKLPDIVNLTADSAQKKLFSKGYEFAYSSFSGKMQKWWHEETRTCITVELKNQTVTSVATNADGDCEQLVADIRKAWEAFTAGQADIHGTELDNERNKLKDQGYIASYWAKDLSPGKSMEFWYNESANKCTYLVFETQGGTLVKSEIILPDDCKNPVPQRKR